MSFVHDDREFGDLLRIVAGERRIAPGLIEKDYWVTHTLWALHDMGFDVWFKGGTSLSKGFGLIERFSEDLDLKVLPETSARFHRCRIGQAWGHERPLTVAPTSPRSQVSCGSLERKLASGRLPTNPGAQQVFAWATQAGIWATLAP